MVKRTCSIEVCDRPAHARGWCTMHYQRWQTHGDPLKIATPVRIICTAEGCEDVATSRRFCARHYRRWRSKGDPQAGVPFQEPQRGRPCRMAKCASDAFAKGLCKRHYMKDREERLSQEPCVVSDCMRPRNTTTGYCAAHYQRFLKYGDPLAGGPTRVPRGTGSRWALDEERRAGDKMALVSGETKEYVLILREDPCAYCGRPSKHIDHIIPFSKGGPTDWANLAPACVSCNVRKSNADLLSYLFRQPITNALACA